MVNKILMYKISWIVSFGCRIRNRLICKSACSKEVGFNCALWSFILEYLLLHVTLFPITSILPGKIHFFETQIATCIFCNYFKFRPNNNHLHFRFAWAKQFPFEVANCSFSSKCDSIANYLPVMSWIMLLQETLLWN